MAVLVDPKSGDQYDYSDVSPEEAEADQKKFGFITPEQFAERKKADEEGVLMGAGRKLAAPVVGLTNLGMEAGILDKGTPEEQAQYQEALGRWGAAGEAHEAVHPVSSFVGDLAAQGTLGAISGGAGSSAAGALGAGRLVGAGTGLLTESALTGTAQESVDAITEKRDFSAKAAGMNGLVNMALGGVGAGLGHYAGKLFGAEARAGAETLGSAETPRPARNWVAEIDPGEVPEPISGTRRQARSAGAAAAANREYAAARNVAPEAPVNLEGRSLEDLGALPIEDAADRARVEALKANEEFAKTGRVASNDGAQGITLVDDGGDLVLRDGRHRLTAAQELGRDTVYGRYVKPGGEVIYEGEIPLRQAANDVGSLDGDDLFDAAARDLRDGNGGKGMPKEAAFLAEHSDELTDLAASNTADHLDDVRNIVKDDLSVAAKRQDARKLSKEWTPEHTAEQQRWVKETVETDAEKLLQEVEQSRKAAADVRAGRAGAREGGAQAIDAGGIDSQITKTLREGIDNIRRSGGVEQAAHIDNLKRSVGKIVKDMGRSQGIDEGVKTARGELLGGFYKTLQEGLEDEAKYGKLGKLQAGMNQAFTGLIDAQGRLDARLTERLGDTWNAFGQGARNSRTKASAVASLMKASPLEQKEILRDVADVLDNTRRLAAARAEHGLLPMPQLQRLERGLTEFANDLKFTRTLKVAQRVAKDATPGIGARLADAALGFASNKVPIVGGALRQEGQAALRNLGKATDLPAKGTRLREAIDNRLKAYSRNPDLADIGMSGTLPQWLQGALKGHGGQVAGVAGVGVGAAILGAPGTAGAAERLPDQQRSRDELESHLATLPPDQQQGTLRTAEAFARIQQRTEQRVQGAVSDLFALAKDPKAPPRHRSPEARRIDARAQELDVPRHLARFMGKDDDPVEAFERQAKVINDVVADPAKLARTMAENLGDLPQQQPEIFAKMVAQTMAAVTYLHERMPGVAGKSALDPEGFPPTFEEISEWAGHCIGARYPLDSLDDLASNDLVPEQMEAVQELWPEGYAMFQTTAMREIHSLSQKGGVIPLEALEQIDSALNLDGAGEPILSSAFGDLLKQANAKEAEKMKTQAPPPPAPMQSQGPSRLASSALGSLHGE